MEARQVHQSVGGKEEVGGDHTDGVKLGHHDETHGDNEDEDVASPGIIVGVEALGKPVDAGIDSVLPDRLENPRRSHHTGDGGGQAGTEPSQVPEAGGESWEAERSGMLPEPAREGDVGHGHLVVS